MAFRPADNSTASKLSGEVSALSYSCISLCSTHREKILSTVSILASRQVGYVGVGSQGRGNLSASFDLSDLNQTIARLGNSLADGVGTLSFSLSADNVSLSLLFSTLDNEARTLSILLSNLLLLNSLREFATESHVGNRNILKGNVEFCGTTGEFVSNALGHSLSLSNEFCGVELGDNSLEDFVSDGWQNTFIIVGTEVLYGLVSFSKFPTADSLLNIHTW